MSTIALPWVELRTRQDVEPEPEIRLTAVRDQALYFAHELLKTEIESLERRIEEKRATLCGWAYLQKRLDYCRDMQRQIVEGME